MADELKASPVKREWALKLANALRTGREYANQLDIPYLGGAGDVFLGKSPEGFERVAYDEPLTSGAGWTTRLRPETVDMGFLVADAAPAAKTLVNALRKGTEAASTSALRKITGNAAATPSRVIDEIQQMNLMPGIFAGKNAENANLAKLVKAEEMTAAGIPREQVLNDTGWFQGVDKQWRFEIPDYQAEFKPTPEFFTGQGNVRQYNVFEHPELQKAGYGINDILVKRGSDEGGSFAPVLMNNQLIPRLSTVEIGTTAVKENPSGFSFSPLTAKNINLHELQHAIQYQEGFGKGGSPNTLAWQKEAAQSSIPELKANVREAQVAYDDAIDMGYGEKLINERKLALDNANSELNSNLELANMGNPMDIYKRLSGEVESRLVQKRMQMTPEELKAAPPWTMYDVPEEQQIVRFDYDGIMNK